MSTTVESAKVAAKKAPVELTLVRALTTKDILAISFGLVVCASTWGSAAIGIGTFGMTFIWTVLVSVVLYWLIAMNYAELATTFPSAAGMRKYAEVAFGRGAGIFAAYIYILSFTFGFGAECTFSSHLMEAATGVSYRIWGVITAGVFGLFINLLGIKKVGDWANYLLWVVVVVAVAVPLCAITGWSLNAPDLGRIGNMMGDLSGVTFIGAFLLAMWLFAGFEVVSTLGEECKTPERSLPYGMFGAIGLIGTVKILFALGAAVTIVSLGDLTGAEALQNIGKSLWGTFGLWALVLFAYSASAASALTAHTTVSRMMYDMSRKPFNIVPHKWGWLHPKYRTPWVTLAIYFFMIEFVVQVLGSNMLMLLYVGSFVWICQYLVVMFLNLWLRVKRQDLRRPYKVPLGPARLPALSVFALVATAIFMFLSVTPWYGDPTLLKYGGTGLVVIIVLSIVWYYATKRIHQDEFEREYAGDSGDQTALVDESDAQPPVPAGHV